jgi:excisionase family DNA binding protein
MSANETECLSVAEAASLLNLSEPTIYRRVWDGSLPVVRLSERGALRIPRSALEVPVGAPRTGASPAVEAQAHDGTTREETL